MRRELLLMAFAVTLAVVAWSPEAEAQCKSCFSCGGWVNYTGGPGSGSYGNPSCDDDPGDCKACSAALADASFDEAFGFLAAVPEEQRIRPVTPLLPFGYVGVVVPSRVSVTETEFMALLRNQQCGLDAEVKVTDDN
ncbi:MAG: hypothetical protein GKS06_15770 [Acidobacteria bacterium]|nr:hypothetical protein [Acidobacteriota bacterium]